MTSREICVYTVAPPGRREQDSKSLSLGGGIWGEGNLRHLTFNEVCLLISKSIAMLSPCLPQFHYLVSRHYLQTIESLHSSLVHFLTLPPTLQ